MAGLPDIDEQQATTSVPPAQLCRGFWVIWAGVACVCVGIWGRCRICLGVKVAKVARSRSVECLDCTF